MPLSTPSPPDANIVADYFIALSKKEGRPMSSYKLQKLLYYTQAWSLAQRGRPAFRQSVRAWKDGPAVLDVFRRFKKIFYVHTALVQPKGLGQDDIDLIMAVWMMYREHSGDEMARMTHEEQPWIRAREGYEEDEPSDEPISLQDMRDECNRQLRATEQQLTTLAEKLSSR